MPTGAANAPRAAVDGYAVTSVGDTKRLQGVPSLRLRVGTWRIIFDQKPSRVVVRAVDDRKDVYRL